MNVIARPPVPGHWTLDSFLAWEREQEGRFEFDGAGIVEMNGGTLAHAVILANLAFALTTRLDRSRFFVLQVGLKVLANGRIRYPDVVVLDRAQAPNHDVMTAPIVVAEILSPGTARTDLFDKPLEYGAIPSVLHYVILEQTHRAAMVWTRDPAPWAAQVNRTELRLPALAVTVPLAELYAGVPEPT